jgi:hypothetical protein
MDARAADLNPVSIDPGELQQFEQTYESWVQGIVQNVIPSQRPTVLIDVAYTGNPERMQIYSDLRATQHLPGLPEVMDPHFSHPSESPLSALVASRRIKLIFEHALNNAQEKILAEVLNNKLKINAHAGDQLIFSTIETMPSEQPSRLKDPKFLLSALMASLALAAYLARGRLLKIMIPSVDASMVAVPVVTAHAVVAPNVVATQPLTQAAPIEVAKTPVEVAVAPVAKQAVTPPPPPMKVFQFRDGNQIVIQRLKQVDSPLVSKTASIVNPIQIILKSDPQAVIRVLRKEKPEMILRAIHETPLLFQKTILSVCTPQQRNRIRELAKTECIRNGEVLFAQNLIAAKIHREMRPTAIQAVDVFFQARKSLKQQRQAIEAIRRTLTPPTLSETSPEVQL